ncbi:truncated methicillin resistance-related surface protein [Staphylococcus aureus]|uniref:SasC/FmtB family protein n=1 Tax=Staphylococcus aureus TaxID=1280 RepID=UPI00085C7523|nr:SasC/FmtB family protein [Staphylococcus aureus]SCU02079.1 truncated methicillin resistance-related surface protein [Staphylococcus aureus]SCU05905.1 truncated methicillin resistance-related surface protein [Staphylococcus aureus]SUJ77762.1 truncated methicillin resistance-related surface protein [Staphylococcus aureus]
MNLFRQQKFSIRKFNVGIFSALIATVTFISTNPTTASAAEQNQPAQNQPAQPADVNTQPNANAGAQANPTAQPAAPANQGQPAAQPANQGGQANPAGGAAQPNTQPAGQGNQADPNNAAQAQPGNQAAPANQAGQGNNQATPNNNATPANQTQPANAPAAAQPAAPVAANAQTQDPNASNTREGSINTTLTFDDPAISTDENRQDPTVTVTDKVNGYSLINNGKIGFVNSELRRSDMFDKNNPQNYQARGNVAALGRVNANDSTDHGNFNGISKTVNVKPDSELIINFTTMQTNSKQGATNLVIKDAKKNTELATVNVAKTGTAHLFKVPTDADRLDLQFIPDNTAVADASRITTNKDGYKYYSFIDNVGLFSGSHLYVKNRDLAPKATNNKEFTINTEVGNNGNFGASLKADQFKYEVTLPQGVTYVNDSLTTTFPNGNEDSTVLKNMTVNYDQTANTNSDVTTAKDNGIVAINQVQAVTTKKSDAKAEIAQKASERKTAIEAMNDSTTEEQQAAKDKVDQAVVTANTDIDNAAANTDVDNAKTTNEATIAAITPDANVKPTAKQAIADKVQAQETAIDANNGATTEEKATAKQQVQTEKATADTAIDGAHSNAEVEAAKNAEIAKIEAIQPATTTKDDAKQAITTKANERKTAIAQTQDITAEEIAAANADVDNAVTQANSNIEAANSQNDVDQAKTTGETSIDQVTPTVNKKATARNEITTILNNKLQEIQATPDVTDEEKQTADAEANTENGKANQAISAATTNAQVDEAKANAEAAINAVTSKVVKKQAAKDEIDQLQVAQTSVINNDQNATTEEKEAAIQQLATAVTDAKNNITAATDDNGVDTAKDAGKNSIQSTQPATAVKSNAKNEVDQAVTTQNQAIDNTTGATTEEKNAAKDLVLKVKEKAYQDILNAQTTNDVTQIKDQAVADVQGITADTTIKDVARDELATKANEQKALIAQTADATTEEKEQENQQVDAQLTQGNQNIENAQSIDDVNTAKDNAIQAIDPIQASTDVKTNARAELLTEMQNKITEILSDNTTTNEEKGKDIEPVRATYEEGLNNINTANTTGDVTTAKDTAVQKVQQLHANPVKKPAGKTALDQAAADRKTQIEQTPNASQQEINDAKQEVDAVLNQAKTNVDQSSTNEYVDNAVKEGKAKINAVKTFSEYKKDALAKIADAYNAKVNEEDNSNASTSSEIAEAKQKLAELKQTADQNVNQATSKDDIEVQIHNDLDNINDYTIPTGKKETATTDLYAYADQKKNNISADTNATQDEKQQAIKQVDQNVQTALESINNGVDNSDVDDALTQGKAAIDTIQVDATVKPKANQAIEAKAEDTKESIDHSDQLTAEEKTEALAMIKQITDQAKKGITDATTTAEVEKAKAQGLEAFDNIQIDSTEKQKAIEELEAALDQIEAGVNVDADATTEEKEAFTNALEDILSKATEDISDQTTNAEIATIKNSALEQLKAQRINPVVKKNTLEAIREVVNKQIEIIKNADADASAKEIARTDLGRYFDRFADKLDKTQTNTEVAELQNVTIPAIEAIVPQNDPNANDTNNGTDNNDATANSNANATPENTGQPNVTESTDNANADTSSTTTNNQNDTTTGETTATSANSSATNDANNKPTANNNSSVDASTDNSATGNGTTDKPEVESTNNGTTDKPATETDNATPAESTTNNNSTTTATNENVPTGSTATAPTTASTEATSSADSKDNASVNDSKQNAEVNNSAESQSTNGKVAQPKSENKAKAEKDGRDSTNQSMVESTTETLPSADITEPKVSSNTSKDKEESTTNQTDAEQHNSDTNVTSNEVVKSPSKADTDVSNKPSTSASSEAKDKMTSTNVSQTDDTATADTNDTQKSVGSAANNKAKDMQTNDMKAPLATVSKGSNSANQDMLNVTKTKENKANAKSVQQGKVNKPKQQAKTLPDTGMSHNDDLPYAELALGAGMAFLIRRFTKKDHQTEE